MQLVQSSGSPKNQSHKKLYRNGMPEAYVHAPVQANDLASFPCQLHYSSLNGSGDIPLNPKPYTKTNITLHKAANLV